MLASLGRYLVGESVSQSDPAAVHIENDVEVEERWRRGRNEGNSRRREKVIARPGRCEDSRCRIHGASDVQFFLVEWNRNFGLIEVRARLDVKVGRRRLDIGKSNQRL